MMAYISLSKKKVHRTKEVIPDVLLIDLDSQGGIVGIEILTKPGESLLGCECEDCGDCYTPYKRCGDPETLQEIMNGFKRLCLECLCIAAVKEVKRLQELIDFK